jgi:hypothetical protein
MGLESSLPPQKMPHDMFCPRQTYNPLHFQEQRYTGILCPKEREREREGGEIKSRAREKEKEKDEEKEEEEKREREKKYGRFYF